MLLFITNLKNYKESLPSSDAGGSADGATEKSDYASLDEIEEGDEEGGEGKTTLFINFLVILLFQCFYLINFSIN